MITFQQLFSWGMSRDVPSIVPFPDGPVLNLGAGRKRLPFSAVDLDLPEWDASKGGHIPYETATVAGIVAFHFLEHLWPQTAVNLLMDCQRVLMDRGSMLIVVPYYNSQMQAQNLDHRSVYCEETWRNLFEDETYERMYDHQWRLRVGFNLICGVVERNMCLATQLIKE